MKTVFISMTLGHSSTHDYFITISNYFVKLGYQVVFITDGQKYELVDRSSNPIILTWPSFRPTKLADAFFLYKTMKIYKPSITISNFGSVNLMSVIGFIFQVPTRVVWIRTLRSQLDSSPFLIKLRRKFVYRLTTRIIANSNAMKKDAVENYNLSEEKIKVFPNALNIKALNKITRKQQELVYAGRLHKSKGIDVLIKSFSKVCVSHKELTLSILGSGEEELVLKALVKSLGLEEKISFLGAVKRDEVIDAFALAALVIVPSKNEAFGYVVIEAMSVKAPVIGSNIDGISEIITDGVDGMLFEAGNVDSLSEKILFALSSPDRMKEMGEQAWEKVNDRYNIKVIASEVVEYLLKDKGKI